MKRLSALFLALMLVCTLVLPVSAAETTLPDPESVISSSLMPYAVIIGNKMYMSHSKPYVQDGKLQINKYGGSSAQYAKWYARTSEWVFDSSSSSTYAFDISELDVVWTTHDINNLDTDTVFFAHDEYFFHPAPLAVMILEVAGEKLAVTLPNLGKVVSILVLCGVGCLALLISLPTLRKVLFRFLG